MSVVFKSYPLENDLEMAAVVLGGLPSSVVKRIGAFLRIRATKVGSIVKISEKTLDRRLKSGARLKPDESERLARLMRIISSLSRAETASEMTLMRRARRSDSSGLRRAPLFSRRIGAPGASHENHLA